MCNMSLLSRNLWQICCRKKSRAEAIEDTCVFTSVGRHRVQKSIVYQEQIERVSESENEHVVECKEQFSSDCMRVNKRKQILLQLM
jgi:hypothetical protein